MSDERPAPCPPAPEATQPAEGDHVPYGYGHPAHKPDPNARYAFGAGAVRPLPVRADRRWRLPG